jgi:hypothetical protein
VLRGGDGTGLDVIEQEVIEQAEEAVLIAREALFIAREAVLIAQEAVLIAQRPRGRGCDLC